MLTVQSVNLSPRFTANDNEKVSNSVNYTETQYKKDRATLEDHMDQLSAVIDDVKVPKTVRTFGKIVSVGTGAALGFVSMKYGSQGVVKLIKKGLKALGKLSEKPLFKKINNAAVIVSDKVKNLGLKTKEFMAKHKLSDKLLEICEKAGEKFKKTRLYGKLSNITKADVEKGVTNFFGLSGGVTGGISALEGVTSDRG